MNHKVEFTPFIKASNANLRRNHEWFHSSVGLECRPVTSETGVQIPLVPPYAPVAQLVEQVAVNHRVVGSSPTGSARVCGKDGFSKFQLPPGI